MKKESLINNKDFRKELISLALPITLQGIFYASFNVIDQLMTGQLGSSSIAAIGIAGKFISIFSVMINTFGAIAGIIIAQAIGKKDKVEEGKGFYSNLFISLIIAIIFISLSMIIPEGIMSLYSVDSQMIKIAASYLRIYSISFIFIAITTMCSTYLRCVDHAKEPLYAGIISMVTNTILNYILIFGFGPIKAMGVIGASIASVLAQLISALILLFYFLKYTANRKLSIAIYSKVGELKSFIIMLLPLFISEFLWVLGENVYGSIYGHVGTKQCAAMTLMNPIVSLEMGAMTGISSATGIIVGKYLGSNDRARAYESSKKLLKTALIGAVIISAIVALVSTSYVKLFNVEADVRAMSVYIILVFALVAPVKVLNMTLGSGVLRSGGKTAYIAVLDSIGTWCIGVPLGILAAFYLNLPIWWVYFLLSLEECFRLAAGLFIFKSRRWMGQL